MEMKEFQKPFTWITIHMADDEWSSQEGGRIMENLARKALTEAESPEDTVVDIYEHAGWWLSYALVDGEIRIVASANDRAYFPPEIREAMQRFSCRKHELVTIWRQKEKTASK